MSSSILKKSLNLSLKWIEEHGWESYDLYDVLGLPFLLKIQRLRRKSRVLNLSLSPLVALALIFSNEIRKVFNIKKSRDAVVSALLAKSFLNLYQLTGEVVYLKRCEALLEWLLENSVKWDKGIGWGYNFNWEAATVMIPARTPISVVTSIVTRLLISAYELTQREYYLNVLREVMEFFLNDLNKFKLKSGVCFSYTPIDDMMVHNANLMIAEALVKLGALFKVKEAVELAFEAVRFTISDQNLDGSFYYFFKEYAKEKSLNNVIDNFHTGYVIYSLCEIYRYRKEKWLESSLVRAKDFYFNKLFKGVIPVPRYPPPRFLKNRILCHDCSQGILTTLKLASLSLTNPKLAIGMALWAIHYFQDPEGYFYYSLNVNGVGLVKKNYMRWGLAWMLLALTELFKYFKVEVLCSNEGMFIVSK